MATSRHGAIKGTVPFFPVLRKRGLSPFFMLVFIGVASFAHSADVEGENIHRATSHRSFENVEHWKKIFDDPARDEWQKPQAIVQALGVAPGMKVADIGAGTGYFSAHLSKAVGETGSVFAVEVEPNFVTHLRERAEAAGTENVIPVLASLDNPRLPANTFDLVLFVDAYHHVDHRREYLKLVAKSLVPGGRVAVIEWKPGELPVGPKDEDHKLAEKLVIAELTEAGFVRVPTSVELPHQYFVIFSRPASLPKSP
jgi:SAM-dependent methyltransferase